MWSRPLVQSTLISITKCYETPLPAQAANMVVGYFGGAFRGPESVCVQTMTGYLYFLEGGGVSLVRRLPNFLVPGPLCYNAEIDAIATCNASFIFECYRYERQAALEMR